MYGKIESDARQRLETPQEYPGLVQRKRAQEAFRLWRRPAFDPDASWFLISDEKFWFVRRIVYVPLKDAEDGTVDHSTHGSEAIMPEAEAGDLLRGLTQLRLPPFPPRREGIGLDGCKYGVQSADMYRDAQLSWWCRAPDEWTGLRDWYAMAIELFEARLPACGVALQNHHPWVE